jgi:hypothetical protein
MTTPVPPAPHNGLMHTNPIAPTLASLVPGAPVTFENLTMVPLLVAPEHRAPRRTPPYFTLDDALSAKACEITEVSEHGSVPELRVINRGPEPVLIVDGEELIGAKQDRVVNLTILVAAQADLTIPVSCVEAGRWRARSRTFASAPRAQYAAGRAKRMSQVTASIRDIGARHADQADVWHGIAEKSARLGASSPTSAMEAMYLDHGARLDRFVQALPPLDRQSGALFAVNGEIVGLDVFDRPETLRKLLPKLVRSVALDAIDRQLVDAPRAKRLDVNAAVPYFIAALSSARAHVSPALGMGDDVRLSAPGLTGAALVVDGVVIHASGFVV